LTYFKCLYSPAQTAKPIPLRIAATAILDYISNYIYKPAVKFILDQIGPGSKKAPVQTLAEVILWTVFPAAEGWAILAKRIAEEAATEPDTYTAKVYQIHNTTRFVNLLFGKAKYIKKDISIKSFIKAAEQLAIYIFQLQNKSGTTLYGFVGIGI